MRTSASQRDAGQVIVAGFAGLEAPTELLEQARDGLLGGVILFRRNLRDVHDVSHLITTVAASFPSDAPPLVGVDQEGGRVQRLREGVLQLPPMRTLAELQDPDLCKRTGRALGMQLRALGFTMNFAPVLDVDTNPQNPIIGDRAFGSDPATVIEYGLAFADGLREAGVAACGKHFPGHGDTDLDSHLSLPRLRHPRARLRSVELAPFTAALQRVDALMSAHVVVDAYDPHRPATLSQMLMTRLLRRKLGYQGLVISDDLEMAAVAQVGTIEQNACAAVEAGCDCLLICSEWEWVERAREALAERADRDIGFAQRLANAAARNLTLRRRHPPAPLPSREALKSALQEGFASQVRDELERRLEG